MRQFLMAMVFAATPCAVLAEDGIFADFTTNMGDFSVKLDFVETPRTVANFVSLAEGSRRWVDPLTGAVMAGVPFYDGVTFHRVIAGFMSQSGSRNGLGTDGPGYRFRDEISPNLSHHRHVISMANSGLNSNGAQFFITDEPTPWLDGKHSVFGRVVAGGGVVDAINAVPVAGVRPVTPVVIESVRIRRVGASAVAFDVMAWDLPVVSALPGRLEVTPGGPVRYHVEQDGGRTLAQGHSSLDLVSWTSDIFRREDEAGSDPSFLDLGVATAPRQFFNFSQVRYFDALPSGPAGRVLNVLFDNGSRLIFSVTADGQTGSCEYLAGGSTVTPIFETYTIADLLIGDFRFNTVLYGGLRVDVVVSGHTTNQISGLAEVYQLDGATWNFIGYGTFTLTQ